MNEVKNTTQLNRKLWLAGHVLSLAGLIDEACQMRDLSWCWQDNEADTYIRVMTLLSRIEDNDPTRSAFAKSIGRHVNIRS